MHQDESPLAQLPLKVSYYTIPPPDPEEPKNLSRKFLFSRQENPIFLPRKEK